MEDILDVKNIHIPDGVLHDQKLKSAGLNGNVLTLVFDIEVYENDYYLLDFYKKFKDFKICTVTIECDGSNVMLLGNKNNKIKGAWIELDEFVNYVNNSGAVFNFYDIFASGAYEVHIEFVVNNYSNKNIKFRKYKGINTAILEVNTDKITFEWK